MPIQVLVADEQSAQPVDAGRWEALARAVLRQLSGDHGPDDLELTVTFVDEEEISSLNARFLGRAFSTDVLAFPIEDDPFGDLAGPRAGRPPLVLGDVVICPEVASRNAPEHAGTYDDEVALLLVHGILHLAGMDHVDPDEAQAMESLEEELLTRHHQRTRA